jgi:hypothetical protein
MIAWQAELLRRQRVEHQRIQDEANKSEDKVRIRTVFTQAINNEFTRLILAEILGMNNAFNAKAAADLPEYGEALLSWQPEIDESLVGFTKYIDSKYHTAVEIAAICAEVRDRARKHAFRAMDSPRQRGQGKAYRPYPESHTITGRGYEI